MLYIMFTIYNIPIQKGKNEFWYDKTQTTSGDGSEPAQASSVEYAITDGHVRCGVGDTSGRVMCSLKSVICPQFSSPSRALQ